MTDDVRIPCHGEQLAAYVYRPDTTEVDAPCVVMAHGFSGTRDDGLPGYAEAFRDAGFVVIVFDYRHFGDSTGEPRQLINIARQLDDYRAVISGHATSTGSTPTASCCGEPRTPAGMSLRLRPPMRASRR